jgi:hypothetical protein
VVFDVAASTYWVKQMQQEKYKFFTDETRGNLFKLLYDNET